VLEHREAASDYTLSLAIGLREAGAHPLVIATPQLAGKAAKLDRARGVKVYPFFKLAFKGGLRNLPPYAWGWLRTIALLAARRPDAVHVQWLVRPRLEARLLPLLARLLRFRLVYTAHNVLPHERTEQDVQTYGEVYRGCDAVIVHTDKSRRELLERWPEIAASRIVTIPHGNHEHRVDPRLSREEARRRLGLRPDRPVVAFVGKLRPYKGVHLLLDAWTEIRGRVEGQVLIAGHADDADYGRQLEATIAERGLGEVTMLERYLSDDEMNWAFAAADVVALPYAAIDQSGILLYAMSHGRAVVASRLESFVELYGGEEDSGALFFDPGDSRGLADALERVLSDPALRERLADRAREVSDANHSWRDIAQRTSELYVRQGAE
jgi:glycosyltransferase involved in cell wall biosynthesis